MKSEDLFRDLSALETERLVLRKLTSADAEDVFAYASDPERITIHQRRASRF